MLKYFEFKTSRNSFKYNLLHKQSPCIYEDDRCKNMFVFIKIKHKNTIIVPTYKIKPNRCVIVKVEINHSETRKFF